MAKFTAKQFSQALSDLTRVPAKIAPAVARGIKADIESNFDAGQDPYKRAWAPLRPATLAKGRHPPPLTDTGKGRAGIAVFATARSGVQITSSVSYMATHQTGRPNMAARKFLPENVLPAAWRAIWQSELSKAVRERLSRA